MLAGWYNHNMKKLGFMLLLLGGALGVCPASSSLVVYFSNTGHTKRVAEVIAKETGSDLVRLEPAVPYTKEDLDYNVRDSRANREQNDDSCRPLIKNRIAGWDTYSIVYLGYPIWWGKEPRILDTFCESYSFMGKSVVPFCTSGSSGVGQSARNMEQLADGGSWLAGKRFGAGASRREIVSWLKSLSL